MFSGSALLEFGRKLGIWSIPGVTLHFHASHSKCQHHDTIIIWKSRAPVCSTHKLYSFVEPCFPGNAWPWHQPRPYERTWQNTSLISRLIWDAVHCLLLGCDWQLVWTHSVLPLNRQGALWCVCLTTRSVTDPVFLSEAGHCREPCLLTACFGETGGCTRGALVYSRLITPALSITVWTQNHHLRVVPYVSKHGLSIRSAGSKNLSLSACSLFEGCGNESTNGRLETQPLPGVSEHCNFCLGLEAISVDAQHMRKGRRANHLFRFTSFGKVHLVAWYHNIATYIHFSWHLNFWRSCELCKTGVLVVAKVFWLVVRVRAV